MEEELRSLQDTVNTLQLKCSVLENTNEHFLAEQKDLDALRLELTSVKVMLEAKDRERTQLLQEMSAKDNLHGSIVRDMWGLKSKLEAETTLRQAKEKEAHLATAALALKDTEYSQTAKSTSHALEYAQQQVQSLTEKYRSEMALREAAETELSLVRTSVGELENEFHKRTRELESTVTKRRCLGNMERVFALTAFSDMSLLGSVVNCLGQLRGLGKDPLLISLACDITVDECVTHVVVPNDNVKSTPKILSALVQGKWVVPVAYLTACLEAKAWLPEDDHGVRYDPPPFMGKKVFISVEQRFRNPAEMIVQLGGGEVIESTLKADYILKDWQMFIQTLTKGRLEIK